MKTGSKKNLIILVQHNPLDPLLEGASWYHFLGILLEVSLLYAQKMTQAESELL